MIRRTDWSTMVGRSAKFQNLLLVVMLFSVMCVSNASSQTVDEIFQNFKTAYEKSENFSANFEETTLFANTRSVARGRFIFGKPNLLRKEYVDRKDASKVVQLTILDGEYGWTYTPLLNQVNKMKWNNPERRELLPGIGASLEDVQKNYNMTLIPDEFANPKGVHQIELTPKASMVSTNAKETLQIWVKSDEWLPVQVGYKTEFEDGTRQSVIVKFLEIKRNKKLAPDLFKFVVPEDAEVIDLSEN
ncbi:MAG: outer membrane lipoprotein carrier protein LolA [Candidatus Poribacteria bacterium]|nr:outer membrane lipoprotein carrier protein LolA [Candidatus Poribacteria bacterium]